MRLIDAVALRKAMYHEAMEKDSDESKWESGCWIRYKMFERVLKTQPTIDPVKHGRWVMQGTAYGCSLCGEGVIHPFHNYCPNCGARMGVPDNDVGETEGEEDE